jgi:ABC-2 type transport system permease protein
VTLGRYARLLAVQARASFVTSMQYRVDFVIEGMMSLYWLGWNLIPLLILFDQRETVAGWDFPSALIVIAWFTVLRGVLEGAINPSLEAVVYRIRTGEFDYVLLKPADAQFLVSTARFSIWRLVDVAGGLALIAVAFSMKGRAPAPEDAALAAIMLLAAVLVLYSVWILIVSACFWVVRLDNLTYLFSAIFDAARWPVQVFRGFWRVLFTLVIPLAVMTTFPAMAILGTLDARTALLSLCGALVFAAAARALWRAAIGSYTSASS